MEADKEGIMTRIFTIKETPNEQGFDRYFVVADSGKPYEEARRIPTSNKVVLFKALAEWILEGK